MALLHDSLGLPLRAANPAALAAYERAVDAHLHAWPGTLAALDEALAQDPDFALAHALRALPLATYNRMAEARAAAARAVACAAAQPALSERERAQVALIAAMLEGRARDALALVLEHAGRWPTDAVAVATALGAFGLLAFSGRIDHDAARLELVEAIAPHYPADHAWLLAHRAWVRIECGQVSEGMDFARRSLAVRPANGNIAHILMHGHFEAGDADAALAFIDAWLSGYPGDALLWGHLHWHAALAHLAQGHADAALARLLGPIAGYAAHGAPFMRLTDEVSLDWRLAAAGIQGLPWARAAAIAQQHYPQGSNPFGELHLALLAAAQRDGAGLGACRQRLQAAADRGHGGAAAAAQVAVALEARQRGDPEAAALALQHALAELPRLGGSHAQRTLVELLPELLPKGLPA